VIWESVTDRRDTWQIDLIIVVDWDGYLTIFVNYIIYVPLNIKIPYNWFSTNSYDLLTIDIH
jgi:hypothetical protein